MDQNQYNIQSQVLNWNNTWQVLKKMQRKKYNSLKKSKALIFRIKCINNILPTKDICFQRNLNIYKNPRCIACFRKDESLYHIAECEIYQKIWKNLESEAIQLTGLELETKFDITLDNRLFRSAIFGEETESIIQSRRLLLRGLTSYKQYRKVTELTNSKRKSNRALVNFLEQF